MKTTRPLATGLAIAFGAGLLMTDVSSAAAQSRLPIDSLIPLVQELSRKERRLSHDEIQERALSRGADELFYSRRPGPRDLYRSYRAYQEEKWALEDYERERRQRRRERVIGAFGNFFKSLANQR